MSTSYHVNIFSATLDFNIPPDYDGGMTKATWMNEYDINNAIDQYDGDPVLGPGERVMKTLLSMKPTTGFKMCGGSGIQITEIAGRFSCSECGLYVEQNQSGGRGIAKRHYTREVESS